MFDGNNDEGRVQPIRFKSIGENDNQNYNNHHQHHHHHHQWRKSNNDSTSNKCDPNNMCENHQDGEEFRANLKRRICHNMQASNFSMNYSYPAVILEDICFSVDKSQQQSNFLNECLARLGQCTSPLRSKCHRQDGNRDSQKIQILKSVNLNVPNGTIFGLLGPSSCGKTTLLRCLVGLLKPNSGAIRLFGCSSFSRSPDAREGSGSRRNDCKVPGANVGYMPQDLGLYEDFTINQLLTMFGNYMRMNSKLIETRIKFMANFLELPDVHRKIQTLSGGQKRRVSFAIACLHMPPLIILDEPTVGVDPLLRRSIWKYLRRLASEENKTIIITTHYIEEAAQADQVALMRAGEILIQDSPNRIIQSNNSRNLEEAFLKICNNVRGVSGDEKDPVGVITSQQQREHNNKLKIIEQPKFQWPAEPDEDVDSLDDSRNKIVQDLVNDDGGGEALSQNEEVEDADVDPVIRELKLKAQEKLAIYDKLNCNRLQQQNQHQLDPIANQLEARDQANTNTNTGDNFCLVPDPHGGAGLRAVHNQPPLMNQILAGGKCTGDNYDTGAGGNGGKSKRDLMFRRNKFVLNDGYNTGDDDNRHSRTSSDQKKMKLSYATAGSPSSRLEWRRKISLSIRLFWALLYKNYRRNVNSIPLLAFQFMLPMIQMISFSLCVGGRPTNVGLGIVNHDNPISFLTTPDLISASDPILNGTSSGVSPTRELTNELYLSEQNDSLSLRYLSFIDTSMLNVKLYNNLNEALADVRRAKLWAALEIGENFTVSIAKRFDLENFYQLDLPTIHQSVVKLYPDRSNKILDMICQRSLVDSYRKFLSDEFEHFKRLPIEIARPIFDIKPNVISNSIDGYTESIAPGLLASLTYIMAAGLTTFIMVVERSAGILERTYTSGINPVAYLIAHALFRSMVMMIQIGFVLGLTFYVLKQPLVGSIWLAYFMLMTLNVTGIAYGLLISSIVTDQNGAALTIVSSLVVKITLSGILWPFEAIPHWLRTICYIQPLTMPVQALKAITLKGATMNDRVVGLGFLVSISWLIVFLTISTKRFKFYQH